MPNRMRFMLLLIAMLSVVGAHRVAHLHARDTRPEQPHETKQRVPGLPSFEEMLANARLPVHEITSSNPDPAQREHEIRDMLEEAILYGGINDWFALRGEFDNNHLTRMIVYRKGKTWRGKIMMVLPIDQFNATRRMLLKERMYGKDCASHATPLLTTGGEKSAIIMLYYTCFSEAVT